MRITFAMGPYFPVPPVFGSGAEKVHLALAEAFARRGHEVAMVSRAYGDFASDEVRAGVRHLRVASCDAPRSRFLFRYYDLLYSRRVAEVLPQSDITITNSFFLPMVLRKRRAGRLYIHAARYPKGQFWLYCHVDRVQAVSAAVAEAIRRQTPVLANRISIIPPPLIGPLAGLLPADRIDVPRDRTILYIGRMAAEKGVHVLVEAFASEAKGALAGYRLRLAGPHERRHGGDGPDYVERLKTLAAPAGEAVRFEGFIPDIADLRRLYEAADIFVYPSLAEWGESFGMAPLEAMAAGCRVLVSDLACFRDYLDPGRNGLVFDHRHDRVAALARALAAMAGETDMRAMRRAAVATAGGFGVETIAGRLLDDFASLLGTKGSG